MFLQSSSGSVEMINRFYYSSAIDVIIKEHTHFFNSCVRGTGIVRYWTNRNFFIMFYIRKIIMFMLQSKYIIKEKSVGKS